MYVFIVEEWQGWGDHYLLGVYSTQQKAEERVQAYMLGKPGDWHPSENGTTDGDIVADWSWGSSGYVSLTITRHTLDPVG